MRQPKDLRRLGRVAESLVDRRQPYAPEAIGVGLALAGLRRGKLSRLAPGGGCALRQQRHQVKPGQRRRGQVLASAQFGRGQLQRRLEPYRSGLPLPLGDGQRGLNHRCPANVDAAAQRLCASRVAAKQQRLGQAATQRGWQCRAYLVRLCKQPIFQCLCRRFGKAAEHAQHLFGQRRAQRGLQPREELGVEGLQHGTAQRAAPQMREAVDQLGQAIQMFERAAAVDHQPHRRRKLLFLLKAERIAVLELHQLAPGIEPGLGAKRVVQHLGKTRRPVRRCGAHAPLRVARRMAAGEQTFEHTLDFGRVKGRAAWSADACRGHHLGQSHQAGRRLQRTQRVVNQGVVHTHVAVEGGDVAYRAVGGGGRTGRHEGSRRRARREADRFTRLPQAQKCSCLRPCAGPKRRIWTSATSHRAWR